MQFEGDVYILRHGDKRYRTKIQMGFNDLILYKKEAGGSWIAETSSLDWPKITLTYGTDFANTSAEQTERVAK